MSLSADAVSTGDSQIDYAKLRKDLERVAARLCPDWLFGQRDDLVQAAAMRVMQIVEADASRPNESRTLASSYLYRVVHSAMVDEIRRVRRRREDSLEAAGDESTTFHGGTQVDPERIAVSRQIGRGIRNCLTRMTRDRRLAVTLYLQGHTVPEASRILDWSAKRTENLVYRGLADLRDCLKLQGMRP